MEGHEEIETDQAHAFGGRSWAELDRCGSRLREFVGELPCRSCNEPWNRAVLRYRAHEVSVIPVPEEVVGVRQSPLRVWSCSSQSVDHGLDPGTQCIDLDPCGERELTTFFNGQEQAALRHN